MVAHAGHACGTAGPIGPLGPLSSSGGRGSDGEGRSLVSPLFVLLYKRCLFRLYLDRPSGKTNSLDLSFRKFSFLIKLQIFVIPGRHVWHQANPQLTILLGKNIKLGALSWEKTKAIINDSDNKEVLWFVAPIWPRILAANVGRIPKRGLSPDVEDLSHQVPKHWTPSKSCSSHSPPRSLGRSLLSEGPSCPWSPSTFRWNQCYHVVLSSISAFSASWLCLLLHLPNGILGSLTTQTISIFIIFIVCNTALDPGQLLKNCAWTGDRWDRKACHGLHVMRQFQLLHTRTAFYWDVLHSYWKSSAFSTREELRASEYLPLLALVFDLFYSPNR